MTAGRRPASHPTIIEPAEDRQLKAYYYYFSAGNYRSRIDAIATESVGDGDGDPPRRVWYHSCRMTMVDDGRRIGSSSTTTSRKSG